jgi:hypothetical protein
MVHELGEHRLAEIHSSWSETQGAARRPRDPPQFRPEKFQIEKSSNRT